MRDFTKSPEPPGQVGGSADGRKRFLVQRHRARRLHYDLRFEVDGVLVSWAVPQGTEPRSGAQVAGGQGRGPPVRLRLVRGDHPERLRQGRRHPVGRRLVGARPGVPATSRRGEGDRGRRVQVRPRSAASCAAASCSCARPASQASDDDQWLLIHKEDDDAVAGWDPEDHPRSVLSARTNDDVADGRPGRWAAATDRPSCAALDAAARRPRRSGRSPASPSRSPTSTR